MKECYVCKELKDESEFFVKQKNKNGSLLLMGRCKKCHSQNEMERYYEKRKFVDEKKTNCIKCGESRARCISFHHVDPSAKEFTIGQLLKSNLDVIQQEIDKCVCLCLNCHHEFHYLNNNQGITLDEYLR